MAVAYVQEFAVEGEHTTTNYDAVTDALNLTSNPDGLIVHTAGFDGDLFRIFDVWETREQGERFINEQLNPILEQLMANPPSSDFRPPTREAWYDLHDTIN